MQANISWQGGDPYPGVEGSKKVERDSGSGFVTLTDTLAADATSYEDGTLSPGVHTYRVSAINALGSTQIDGSIGPPVPFTVINITVTP